MTTFLILVGIFIVGKFIYDKNKQSVQVGRQGGMLNKYKVLVDHLMSGHDSCKIYKTTSDSVLLGASSSGGTTMFHLIQTFGKLSVKWEMKSPLFGKHNLEWEFQEFMDQEKMVENILNDLGEYQKNAISASPFRDKI